MNIQTFSEQSGLEVKNLQITYPANNRQENTHTPVKDFSFLLPPGQVVALLGPSGCGKSSILQAVAGLLHPAAGEIWWNGQLLSGAKTHVPAWARPFGFVFQDGQLFLHRNVARNLTYGLESHYPGWFFSRKRRQEFSVRTAELLDLVGLPGFENRDIRTLSAGQAQRVALARSLAPSPELILLDEPLSALDTDLRFQLANDLRKIFTRTSTTAIFVTHDPQEAALVADCTIRLSACSN